MSTFHPFPQLPYELRALIWSFAAWPRSLDVQRKKEEVAFCKYEFICVSSQTSPPAVMHACHEARVNARYHKAFAMGSRPRYLWVNFELDMISVPGEKMEDLAPHRFQIRRLRLEDGDEYWDTYGDLSGHLDAQMFENLKEVYIITEIQTQMWADTLVGYGFGSCPLEDVKLISPVTGLVLNTYQAYMAYQWWIWYSYDRYGKVEDRDNLANEIKWRANDSDLNQFEMTGLE